MNSTLLITDLSPFAARVRLVSLFTGVSFNELPPPGGAGSDAMKAISPFGKVPTLVALLFNTLFPHFGVASPFTTHPRLISWWAAIADVPKVANVFTRMEGAIARVFGTT